jgi:hypothetical protein
MYDEHMLTYAACSSLPRFLQDLTKVSALFYLTSTWRYYSYESFLGYPEPTTQDLDCVQVLH